MAASHLRRLRRQVGEAQTITGGKINTSRFPGQWAQSESALFYNWHRHYDPSIGRYTQPDPLGFVDGPSVYAYAGNNPMANVDPTGESVIKAVKMILNEAGEIIGPITKKTISFKTAVLLRRAGKNCRAVGGSQKERLKLATEIEEAAFPEGELLHHPKDAHKNKGNQPHVQTKGQTGHTFYELATALTATAYLGDGLFGNAVDLVNPFSLSKDVADTLTDILKPDGGAEENCDCSE